MIVHNYNFNIYLNQNLTKEELLETYSYNNILNNSLKFCNTINMGVVKHDGHIFKCPIEGLQDTEISNTGFIILTTSHLAWHTFPEENYISLQLSTCGEPKNIEFLKELLKEIFISVDNII